MQSIIDQTTGKDFQQKPDKSSCHIFHLANLCQPKTLISGNNKVGLCSSTLLFKHEIVPNALPKMQEAQLTSQVTANFSRTTFLKNSGRTTKRARLVNIQYVSFTRIETGKNKTS